MEFFCLAAAGCSAQNTVKCSVAELKSQTFEDGKTYRLVITDKEPNMERLKEVLKESESKSGAFFELELTNCERLEEIEFCQLVECSVLEKIKLSSSVTEIGWGAFRSCENLTEIVIPNSVTEIGPKAFEGGASLKRIKLPKQLKRDDIRDGLKIPETTEIEYY